MVQKGKSTADILAQKGKDNEEGDDNKGGGKPKRERNRRDNSYRLSTISI